MSVAGARALTYAKFGNVLRVKIKQRGLTRIQVAAATGISASSITHYTKGENVPTIEVARRLAILLDAPKLVEHAQNARRYECDNCKRRFICEGVRPSRFCSVVCHRLAVIKRGQGKEVTAFRAVRAERALTVHQDAVGAMCNACEPDGLCKTVDCPLRAVSPLQLSLSPSEELRPIPPRGHASRTPTWRAGFDAYNKRRWTDEERAKTSERMRQRAAERTPEERKAFGEKVSKGRRAYFASRKAA